MSTFTLAKRVQVIAVRNRRLQEHERSVADCEFQLLSHLIILRKLPLLTLHKAKNEEQNRTTKITITSKTLNYLETTLANANSIQEPANSTLNSESA
jgi:hypothetical protein